MRRLLEAIRPTIVRILAYDQMGGRDAVSASPRARSALGFLVAEWGLALTTQRAVRGTSAVTLLLADGRTLPVSRIARDPLNDLAILKVEATRLPTLPIGNSNALKLGDLVTTLGERPDLPGSVGTIRATTRDTGSNLVADFPGKPSGAGLPLVNMQGEVVGIITDTARGRGTAIIRSIPIDRAKPILKDLQVLVGRRLAGSESTGFASTSPSER